MGIAGGIVVYIIIWWAVVFAVLPFGITRNDGTVAGADPGAPQVAGMKRKMVITSVIAAVIWLGVFAVVESDIISFRAMAERME